MDTQIMLQAMKTAISKVLEQMFFLPIDFIAPEQFSDTHDPAKACILAKLGFSGTPGGTFVLQVPLALAQSVSADFSGDSVKYLTSDQINGTILELLNMLAGSTLSFYDRQALFDLQIPELITCRTMHELIHGTREQIPIMVQTPGSRMVFLLILN